MNAPMKRTIILLCCLLPGIIAFGQGPEPPTQEWCKWAFGQIPDNTVFADADSTAFSSDFYCLLKEVDRLDEWFFETYECEPPGAGCTNHWYSDMESDMESSRLDGGRAKVYFDFTPKSPLEGEVLVTIDHPDYLNYDGTRVSNTGCMSSTRMVPGVSMTGTGNGLILHLPSGSIISKSGT